MKILAVGDFHGKFPVKLQKLVKKEDVDLILGIGDYGDSSALRDLEFKHWALLKRGRKSFEDIIGLKKYKSLLKSLSFSMGRILKILQGFGKPIISIYGNSELLNNEAKKYHLKGIESLCEKRKIKLLKTNLVHKHNWAIIGFSGYRGASPKGLTKLEKGERKNIDKLNSKWDLRLKKLFQRIKFPERTIFISHDVPLGYFDKINFKGYNPMNGKHIGDKYLLKYIKKYQPKVLVCGHMHEHQGIKKIGKTFVIAIGAALDGKAAIIDIDDKEKVNVKFIK